MKFAKKLALTVLVTVTAFALAFPAMAAEKKEKISSATIKLSGTVPVAGDATEDMGVDITTGSNKFTIDSDYSYDTNKDEWKRGDVPVIEVELEAEDDYKFTSSTKVHVEGLSSSVKSKSTKEGGDVLRVYIKIKAVGGEVEAPDELEWSGEKATWEDAESADYYEVELKRGSNRIAVISTDDTHFNFHRWMVKPGDYKFRVRTVAKHDGKKSKYSEYSDDLYMDSNDCYEGTIPTETDFRSKNNLPDDNGNGSNGGNSALQNTAGEFRSNQYGWYFVQNNNYVTNMWVASNGYWYHIGANGYMDTGWFKDTDGHVYYLNPANDSTFGAMVTGLQNIAGSKYYFSETPDPITGPVGSMRTGYTFAAGNWYFFDTNTGAAWMNCASPNGRYCGPDGVINLQ